MGRKRKIGITTSKIYQMDIRFGKIHAKIHNSGKDKSGTDQHRGRLQGPQISRKDKKIAQRTGY